MDEPVHIKISGLPPGKVTSVQLRSKDSHGIDWASSATFKAGASGDLNLDRARSLSGSYRGVHGMGLIWSMQPTASVGIPDVYYWAQTRFLTFTVTVKVDGNAAASTQFQRRSMPALIEQRTSLRLDGFVGKFSALADSSSGRPAILLIGGSEGGFPSRLLAVLLASHGYPVLAVAYFGEPGLPRTVSSIPLEYFGKALTWLSHQRQVLPAHILTLGISRGSEAALLLGVHYPKLVHGVIATVPSSVSLCSIPGCDGPAWTLRGRALPFSSQYSKTNPTDNPAAIIPVERIRGPVFLACGGADQTWASCAYAPAIISRLDAHHYRWPHFLYSYPAAGHRIGGLVPYEPALTDEVTAEDQAARAQLWPQLLRFLAASAP